MATYTPTTPIDDKGHDHKPPVPPAGGGDDERDGSGPDYGARLRRARLGLICAIVTVCMVFISLTSAYIVRQGLPTFDDASNSYIRDWGEVHLPWLLLAINTVVLLISSVTMEFARRDAARQAALDSRCIAGKGAVFPMARNQRAARFRISCWAVAGVGRIAQPRVLHKYKSEQLIRISAYDNACRAPNRWTDRVAVGSERFLAP